MASSDTKPSLLFTCTFWGYSHTQIFVDVLLPSLLTPENLPRISQYVNVSFSIITTSANLAEIETRSSFVLLKTYATVHISIENNLSADRKFEIHHRHWRQAIDQAKQNSSFLCLLPPDICFSDGSLEAIAKRIIAKAAAIYVSGIRVATETFVPEVMANYFVDGAAPKPISHRELVELTLKHSHPFNNSLYIDSPQMPYVAEMLLAPVANVGWVKHCYVAGPIVFVDPQKVGLNDYQVVLTVRDRADFHIIYDSHEFGMVSISPLHLYGDWYIAMGHEALVMRAYKYNFAYRSETAELISQGNFELYVDGDRRQQEPWCTAKDAVDDAAANIKSSERLLSLGAAVVQAGLQRAGNLAVLAAFAEAPQLRLDRDGLYYCVMPEDSFLAPGTVGCLGKSMGMSGIENFLSRHIFSSLKLDEGTAINLANEKIAIERDGAAVIVGGMPATVRGGDSKTIILGVSGCLAPLF